MVVDGYFGSGWYLNRIDFSFGCIADLLFIVCYTYEFLLLTDVYAHIVRGNTTKSYFANSYIILENYVTSKQL